MDPPSNSAMDADHGIHLRRTPGARGAHLRALICLGLMWSDPHTTRSRPRSSLVMSSLTARAMGGIYHGLEDRR